MIRIMIIETNVKVANDDTFVRCGSSKIRRWLRSASVVVRSHRHKSQSPTPGGGPDEYRR